MTLFIFLLAFAFIATLNENSRMNNSFWYTYQKKEFYISPGIPFTTIILFFIMYVICATREFNVGIDTERYYYSFFHESTRSVEPGYYIIKKFTQYLGNSFQQFLNLFAIITFLPFFLFLKKNSSNIAFSLLIYLSFSNYFYPETFNTIRATASISFFLLFLSYFKEKKIILGIIFAVIAISFHYSSIPTILIALLFFLTPAIPQKITIIAVLFSLILGFFFASGFNEWALSLSSNLAIISEDYVYHLENLKETNFNLVGLALNTLPFSALCIFLHTEENKKNIYYKLFLFSTIIANIFVSVELIYRLTMFFSILITIILPNTVRKSGKIQQKILFGITGAILLIFLLRLTITEDNIAGIIPYSSCISF